MFVQAVATAEQGGGGGGVNVTKLLGDSLRVPRLTVGGVGGGSALSVVLTPADGAEVCVYIFICIFICMCVCVCVCVCVCIYIYIYIYIYMYVCIYIYTLYICIHMFIDMLQVYIAVLFPDIAPERMLTYANVC